MTANQPTPIRFDLSAAFFMRQEKLRETWD